MSRQETKEAFRGVGGCFGILFIIILVISSIQGEIQNIGNLYTPTSFSYLENRNHTLFLFMDRFNHSGRLASISSYYVNVNPIVYQLWRPVKNKDNSFMLIKQWTFVPQSANSSQNHILENGSCAQILPGDTIAIQSLTAALSIAVKIVKRSMVYQLPLDNYPLNPDAHPVLDFGLSYPYNFSTSASIETDFASANDNDCPNNIEVGVTTSVTPVTAERGLPGPRGEKGEKGDKGDQGTEGDQGSRGPRGHDGLRGMIGPQGEQGPKSQPVQVDLDCVWCRRLLTPTVILVLIVWLSLTTLSITIIAACLYLHKMDASSHFRRQPMDLWRKYEDDGDVIGGANNKEEEGFENDSGAVLAEEECYEDINTGRTVF